MCHNLGADENLDPFTYVSDGVTVGYDIKGDLYQWGRVADGHEKRDSPTYLTNDTRPLNGAVPDSALDTNGQVLPGHAAYGKFIKHVGDRGDRDWRQTQNDTLWGDGSTNEDMPKTVNDPCPPGWKVPSMKQWASIFRDDVVANYAENGLPPTAATANTWTWTTSGYMIGSSLFLPVADYRWPNTGLLDSKDNDSFYWSTSLAYDGTPQVYYLWFDHTQVAPATVYDRGYAFSVRCIAE
jgi:uncharacterized protein (TIGR02145 family)